MLFLIQEKPNSHFVSHTICFKVMHLSSVTFKELLSKTLDKLNNIEIRSTNNNYDYFAIFWFIIFFQVNLLKTLLVEKKRNSFGPSCPVL